MTKLYVGNLPFSANEESVRVQVLNGKDFGGRPLKVNAAHDPNRPGPNHSQR